VLTPSKIQELSDPIEGIYEHIVDELLVNIGKHITAPTWTHTAEWEIKKLSELGQLTEENAAIINKWIKKIPPALRETMTDTRREALDRIERQLEQAAKDGYITPPMRDSTVDVLRELSDQAADRCNLVNSNMLQSSVEQYAAAVQLTQSEYERLTEQARATQGILNETAASVASGTETRKNAVRRALKRISDEGLTGFIDRAGREWSPEAYVNMVTRTTVHNTAIQATKARMEDFGTSVFQVSSHAGARPLCYPYQGKFYSWDNTAGEIELGNGQRVRYEPINSTSYGEPAGLFGINCGHSPIPVVPGVTIPHGADNIQPKEENDKAYAESQEQRALERKIREAKRVVAMEGNLATKEDKARVKELQAEMREFIERTGRTRRYDRESIGGTTETAKTPTTGGDLPPGSAIRSVSADQARASIVDSGTAEKVFFPSNMPDETANEIASVLNGLHGKGYPTINGVAYDAKKCAERNAAAFYDEKTNNIYIGQRFLKTPEEFAAVFERAAEQYAEKARAKEWAFYGKQAIIDGEKMLAEAKTGYERFSAYGRLKTGYMLTGNARQNTVCQTMADVLTHEYGHAVHLQSGVKVPGTGNGGTEWNVRSDKAHFAPYQAASDLGAYALQNPLEAVAEAFVAREKGDFVPPFYAELLDRIDGEVMK
jgi:hypothetical protein